MKIHIVGNDGLIEKMYTDQGHKIVESIDEAEIVQFTGGADVTPSFYGHDKHPSTGNDLHRDERELVVFNDANKRDLPMIGICRGSQFLCAMSGGKLAQDVDRHAIAGTHEVTYLDARGDVDLRVVTSTHHQMMRPDLGDWPYEVWAATHLSTYQFVGTEKQKPHMDYEVVFFPHTKALGFQGHPEYRSEECRKFFFEVFDRFLDRVVAKPKKVRSTFVANLDGFQPPRVEPQPVPQPVLLARMAHGGWRRVDNGEIWAGGIMQVNNRAFGIQEPEPVAPPVPNMHENNEAIVPVDWEPDFDEFNDERDDR